MKKGEVVKDGEGNHFIVLAAGWGFVKCESVATREVFVFAEEALSNTDRVTF